MALTKLRRQGGAVIVTIPADVAEKMGWNIGIELAITPMGDGLQMLPASRIPRGRKTLAELLSSIDQDEVRELNDQYVGGLNDAPQGRELL